MSKLDLGHQKLGEHFCKQTGRSSEVLTQATLYILDTSCTTGTKLSASGLASIIVTKKYRVSEAATLLPYSWMRPSSLSSSDDSSFVLWSWKKQLHDDGACAGAGPCVAALTRSPDVTQQREGLTSDCLGGYS